MASGKSATAMAIGVRNTSPIRAAIPPPSTVPPIRSSARVMVMANSGCIVSTHVIVSQCWYGPAQIPEIAVAGITTIATRARGAGRASPGSGWP